MILDFVSELEEGEIFKPKIVFIHQATSQILRNYNQCDLEFNLGDDNPLSVTENTRGGGAFQVIYLQCSICMQNI